MNHIINTNWSHAHHMLVTCLSHARHPSAECEVPSPLEEIAVEQTNRVLTVAPQSQCHYDDEKVCLSQGERDPLLVSSARQPQVTM